MPSKHAQLAISLLAAVGFFVLIRALFGFLVPILNPEGTIADGSYRGLQIGDHKVEVRYEILSSFSKLRLSSYVTQDGDEQVFLYDDGAGCSFMESDIWYLRYPGIHQEIMRLRFEDNRLQHIRFTRDMLSPPEGGTGFD